MKMAKYYDWHTCPNCQDKRTKAYDPKTKHHICLSCENSYPIFKTKEK